MKKNNKCTNRQIGGKLAREITWNVFQRKGVHLTPDESQHLAQCEDCNQLLSYWFKQGDAMRKNDPAFIIVDLAEEGDSRVSKKRLHSGTALFKPHEDDRSKGLLVQVSSTGEVSPTQEVTLDEFNQLE